MGKYWVNLSLRYPSKTTPFSGAHLKIKGTQYANQHVMYMHIDMTSTWPGMTQNYVPFLLLEVTIFGAKKGASVWDIPMINI
jgi:hypothetical protein